MRSEYRTTSVVVCSRGYGMNRVTLLGLIVALCIIATPVAASYSCDPICEADPNGSDKCCFGEGTPVSDNSVTPDDWNDNPTCVDLGFEQGIKFDPPNPVASGNILWDFDPADPYVNWSSSFPVDAVIMKGGSVGANVYYYSPPSDGDRGLATPINPSGKPAGLSHIDFCYNNECTCDDDGNECTAEICDPEDECIHVNLPPGTACSIGVCNVDGICSQGTPVPEFPSLALPVAFMIGIVGLVYVFKVRGN